MNTALIGNRNLLGMSLMYLAYFKELKICYIHM